MEPVFQSKASSFDLWVTVNQEITDNKVKLDTSSTTSQ